METKKESRLPPLVSAANLLAIREKLETDQTPVYRLVNHGDGGFGLTPVTLAYLAELSTAEAIVPQFVVRHTREIGEPEKSDIETLELADEFLEDSPESSMWLSAEEKLRAIHASHKILEQARKQKIPPLEKARAIMGVVGTVFSLNKASLSLNPKELSFLDQGINRETQAIIRTVITMIEESSLTNALFQCFESLSNGQSVNHVIRVFSCMSGFMLYFNRQHSHNLILKINRTFPKFYLEKYRKLLPGLPEHLLNSYNLLDLPHIEPAKMQEYALGALLHDIGKISNMDYFEGDSEFDLHEIHQHALIGSGLIMMNYGPRHEDARLIAGDHHNYLFHKDGYGITRWERQHGKRPPPKLAHCITSSAEKFTSGLALGLLPTEICAIIDIFDALTDKARGYRKVFGPYDAILFMQEKFVANGKIDPVLFDIFIDYLRDAELAQLPGLGFSVNY